MSTSTKPEIPSADSTAHVLRFADLPDPRDFPEREVVIFDGDCRFCLRQVRRLQRWDGGARLAFVSLHDPFVREHYPELTHEQLMKEMYVVDHQGNRLGGAVAFRYLARRLPRLWMLAPFLYIPYSLPIWKLGYRLVAAHRYRISGRTQDSACDNGSCDLHFKK